jgi:hypothetical protein
VPDKRIFLATEVIEMVAPETWSGTSVSINTKYGSFIARTTEDATQNSLDGEQVYNSKVVAPEQVKLTEFAEAS